MFFLSSLWLVMMVDWGGEGGGLDLIKLSCSWVCCCG